MKYYIGIDNGVSGTIALLSADGTIACFAKMPVKNEQSYTKAKNMITRVDHEDLDLLINSWINKADELRYVGSSNITVLIERPMVNPGRFKATMSALRALEATLIYFESIGWKRMYIDSKQWQKVMLPSGLKGAPEQKKASLDIGNRLFPQFKDFKHEDRDGLLIAEFARRANL